MAFYSSEAHKGVGSIFLDEGNFSGELVETILSENWETLRTSFETEMKSSCPMQSEFNHMIFDFVSEKIIEKLFTPLATKIGDRWEQGFDIITQKLLPDFAVKVFERVFNIEPENVFEFIALQSVRV